MGLVRGCRIRREKSRALGYYPTRGLAAGAWVNPAQRAVLSLCKLLGNLRDAQRTGLVSVLSCEAYEHSINGDLACLSSVTQLVAT